MPNNEITRLLDAVGRGDRHALSRLYAQVYGELRQMAAAGMRGERSGHALQPLALVNEAWLRLSAGDRFETRRYFFGAAAEAMRRILVDHAREKRGHASGGEHITLSDLDVAAPEENLDVLAVNDALERLAESDPHLAELVSLRFFAGLSIDDTARALDLSPSAVLRDWTFARAWLMDEARKKR
jgi:RNA polymerase sigma factor (TIGR02999 family)